jgi:thiamine-phosphate pyrophosphorylase
VSGLSNSIASRKSPILCYVTDRCSIPHTEPFALIQKIEVIASAGVDWVQIREKDVPARELVSLTREALRCTAAHSQGRSQSTRILVNDRVDVALAERTGGVHLSENSLPVSEVARLVETHAPYHDFLVGVSCHSLEGAKSAAAGGANYLFFGPVFNTPSKAAFGPPQGLERLAEVGRTVAIPVLAIGGVTLENVSACLAAGAAGIAAIRLFQDSSDPAATVRALRQLSGASA